MSRLSATGGNVQPGPTRIWTDFRLAPILKGRELANGTKAHAAPTGATGDVNLCVVPGYGTVGSAAFEYFIHGTQTILGPVLVDNGLDWQMDQTDNDGWEIDHGIKTRNPLIFTVGTDACYVKLTAKIAVAAGADPFFVGFRKVAARAADFNDWTDFAVLGTALGNVTTYSALNNAATVTTDTTDNWADTETHTLGVFVAKTGAVTYQLDGVTPTTTVAYTFDTGDSIMPVIHLLQANASQTGEIVFTSYDAGLM